eukprot:TRINITY_DN70167_c0_g1_i1.p1 TRINITY_DN70167_c0_g1~~TRINITY_DN70167_c0_g1_i1.p1  ORF type:complete len:1217 (+),score=393.27 TRINITY_DN70167_c0_g1_i1:98-3748(+)
MSSHYISTAQKATAPQHCVVGNFVSESSPSLVVAFDTRLEVWVVQDGGLHRVCEQPLRGRVSVVKAFKPCGRPGTDLLLVLFDRLHVCVLGWDPETRSIVKVFASADGLRSDLALETEEGNLVLIPPSGRFAVFYVYQGQLRLARFDQHGNLEWGKPGGDRLEEPARIIDMCFLSAATSRQIVSAGMQGQGADCVAMAVLSEDHKHGRHVKVYKVDPDQAANEFVETSFACSDVEATAQMLIPVEAKFGGILLVGDVQISYVPPSGHQASTTVLISNLSSSRPDDALDMDDPPGEKPDSDATFMRSWCPVDAGRVLLGDFYGKVYMLQLRECGAGAVELRLEALGYTSITSCIGWLGEADLLYIGSGYGDSSVVRVLAEPNESATRLEVVDSFPCMGPIMDMCVVDTEGEGQGAVVSCSGGYRDGSIRILRNGIGISELAALPEVKGVRGMWSLRRERAQDCEEALVLSFTTETKALGMEGDELAEVPIAGLDSGVPTLFCGNVWDQGGADHWLQITQREARLVSPATRALAHQWAAPAGTTLTLGTASGYQVLVAGGTGLVYLEISGGRLQQAGAVTMEHEVACLSVPTSSMYDGCAAKHCVVGLWNVTVRLLALPSLSTLHTESLGGTALPRSVLLHPFCGKAHLICGLSDGAAVLAEVHGLDSGAPRTAGAKRLSLGTRPIQLRAFSILQAPPDAAAGVARVRLDAVFAVSDKPTVLYESRGKVVASSVNLKTVQQVCPFNVATLGEDNCLAYITDDALTLGSVDGIQSLHVRTVPLQEQPKNIIYHPKTGNYVLLSSQSCVVPTTHAAETAAAPVEDTGYVKLLANHTFELLATHTLDKSEQPLSVSAVNFAEDSSEYVAVGTCTVHTAEQEPQFGRLLIFRIKDDSLDLIISHECKGAVYALCPFKGKLLVGINSGVTLMRMQEAADGQKELSAECAQNGHICTLAIQSRGDFVVFGDLMRSVTVLLYKPVDTLFDVIAHDFNPFWLTALHLVSDDVYLAADHGYQLYMLHHNSGQASDDKRRRLEPCGLYYLGDFVNAFRQGSLVAVPPPPPAADLVPQHPRGYCNPQQYVGFVPGKSVLFGTIGGAVGAINQIPPGLFKVLDWMQRAVGQELECPSGIDWKTFRSYRFQPQGQGERAEPTKGFIDGDLVEQFPDLPAAKKAAVVEAVNRALAAEPQGDAEMDGGAGKKGPQSFTVETLGRIVDELSRMH